MIKKLFFCSFLVLRLVDFCLAQPTTFSINYPDTGRFSGQIKKFIELENEEYFFPSAGFSLFINEGGYQRFTKINNQGEIILDNLQHDPNRRFYDFCNAARCSDGNLLVLNTRSQFGLEGIAAGRNQIFVLKISPDFSDTLWSYYHHDSLWFDTPGYIMETSDGSIALTANRDFSENPEDEQVDVIFLKLSSDGQLLNENRIDIETVQVTNGFLEREDGGFILCNPGGPDFTSSGLRIIIVKLDSNGDFESSFNMFQLLAGDISRYGPNKLLIAGYKLNPLRPKIIMIDDEGGIIFDKTYPGIISVSNYVARRVEDGGIIAVGINNTTVNAGFIMKTDSSGNLLWAKEIDFGPSSDFFLDFIETTDGGLLVAGACNAELSGQDAWAVKLDANGCLDPQDCEVGVKDIPLPDAVTIYPNPAKDWLKIDIEQNGKPYTAQLLDATGRLIQNEQFSGIGTHTLNLSGLAKGIYYCRVMQGEEVVVVEKVVVTSP
jgi:hypothetical protein